MSVFSLVVSALAIGICGLTEAIRGGLFLSHVCLILALGGAGFAGYVVRVQQEDSEDDDK